MKLSSLHKNVNTSSHIKGNFVALTTVYQFELWLKVLDMPSKSSLTRHAGTKKRGLSYRQVLELFEVELTKFHCSLPLRQ